MESLDERWMLEAFCEAELARDAGEVPIGAVIVQNGKVIARAHNRCVRDQNATAHAELLAIEAACRAVGSWRLSDCTMYVTLEPCPMCAGAAVNARLSRIVYAAKDPRAGALGSLLDLRAYPLETRPICKGGLFAERSLALLRAFFLKMRKNDQNP